MAVLNSGNVTAKQASAFFNVTLGEFLFFAECAKAVANNHSGIISSRSMQSKLARLFSRAFQIEHILQKCHKLNTWSSGLDGSLSL